MNDNQQSLSGIRILDFTRVLAGPFCTMLLADLGAEVIKVENPTRGDDTREWGPPWDGDGKNRQSAYFQSVNRNKRSVTLNLKSKQGQHIAKELVAQSDVLIENFKVGQMTTFGLDYGSLKGVNPNLVYCSITGFGQTGPYHQYPGYDYVVQAMSGLMSITGPADREPHKVGVAISDVIAGLFAANAIQAALRHASLSGEGQYIDIALLDTQIATLVNIASNYLVSNQTPPRLGNEHPNIVPYQTFRASDAEFVIAVGNDRQFRLLCSIIKRSDLAEDERYATNPARVANRDMLVSMLSGIFVQHSVEYWTNELLSAGIPTGPIRTVAEALEDEHAVARELVRTIPAEGGNMRRIVGSPIKLSGTPAKHTLAPPNLGEHTAQVLQRLMGYDAQRIDSLRMDGVI